MKKYFLLILCFLLSNLSWSQANNSFENWAVKTKAISIPGPGGGINTTSTFSDPIGWSSNNYYVSNPALRNKTLVSKDSSTKYHLNASVKLRTDTLRLGGGPGGNIRLPAVLVSGSDLTIPAANQLGGNMNINNIPKAGFPFTAAAKSFFGYYKLTNSGETVTCFAQLRKGRTIVATALYETSSPTPGNGFVRFETDFIYNSCLSPDTLVVVFATAPSNNLFGNGNGVTLGTTLWVDSIGLNIPAGFVSSTPLRARADFDTAVCVSNKTISVLSNDDTCGNGALTISILTQSPSKGWATINGNGTQVDFAVFNGVSGLAQVEYKICNAKGECDSNFINVFINKPVDAKNDFDTLRCDTMMDINLTANDVVCVPGTDTFFILDPSQLGTLSIVNHQVHFVLNTGANKASTVVRYRLCDTAFRVCDTATMTIVFASTVDAVNDRDTLSCDTVKTFDVSANDIICPGAMKFMSIVQQSNKGVATLVSDKIQFALNKNATPGNTLIRYSICDLMNGVCDTANLIVNVQAILSANQDNANIACDTAVDIDVILNDTYCAGWLDTLLIAQQSNRGVATIVGGKVHFVKNKNAQNGPTQVRYLICNSTMTVCDTGNINIIIQNGNANAITDTITSTCLGMVSIPVSLNDLKSCNGVFDSLTIFRGPGKGTAVVSGLNINYTPSTAAAGLRDSIIYRICDTVIRRCDTAYIRINIGALGFHKANKDIVGVSNSQPILVKVLSNDTLLSCKNSQTITIKTSPINGTATPQGDTAILYTPNNSFNGIEIFEYQVCNNLNSNAVCDFATVNVFVNVPITNSIDALNIPIVKIYPNPTNEVISIESNTAINRVSIYDMMGKRWINQNSIGKNMVQIDVRELSKGNYYIEIESMDKTISNSRLIKN